MTAQTNPETRYKFIVASAEEAVTVLRDRLGENAKVISVRQVEGAGLARFLRAPKLEVIAQAGSSEPVDEPLPSPAAEAPIAAEPASEQPEPLQEQTAPSLKKNTDHADDPARILQRGGLTDTMLARLRAHEMWPKITRLPLREALTEVAVLLRVEFQHHPKKPLGNCVAFIGTAGAGKTTALCKRLAMDVFFKQKRAIVLKVDLDKANPSDGLAVFCDVLGVPMVRSVDDIPELAGDETLYIDFPGITPDNQTEIDAMSHSLQSTFAVSCVLVVNAAYEIGLIKQAYRVGASLGATHIIFTHLDELMQCGKLWEFILAQELTPLFLSCGQNIAGDFDESVFDAVLSRTFPAVGKEVATNEAEL